MVARPQNGTPLPLFLPLNGSSDAQLQQDVIIGRMAASANTLLVLHSRSTGGWQKIEKRVTKLHPIIVSHISMRVKNQ